MGNYYKLKIYQRGQEKEPETPNEKSTFYVESSTAFNADALLNVLPTNTDILLVLKSLEYKKELYKPSCADVLIQTNARRVSNGDIVKAVMECFRDKSAEISMSDKDAITADTDYFLGKDFLVYSVQPHYEADSSAGVMVDVKLYSRDVLLTEDRFSHCYLNKKLGRDIIEGNLKEGGLLSSLDIKYNVGENRLQVLKTDREKEIIQPYRVQYNEDFHSFISRLAGRCGEFLYFEDGKLCFGIPSGSAVNLVNSTNIKSVRYPQMVKSTLNVKSFYRDYQKDNKSVGKDELVFNESSPYDEYFDVFDKSEMPDSLGAEFLYGPFIKLILTGLLPALFSDAKNHRAYLATFGLTKWSTESAMELGKIAVKFDYVNRKFTENVFSNSEKNTDSFKSDEQTLNDKLSQFSSVAGFDKLFSSYYSAVKSAEKEARDSVICLEVAANSRDCRLSLGDRVRLNDEDTEYIVCKVSGSAAWERNPSDEEGQPAYIFSDRQYVEIVPKFEVPVSAESTSMVSVFMPPYEDIPAPETSAQMAIVADSEDPRYMGRVRIKYPWQSESEKASPWVRFVSPMASKNGATAHFKLTKGDEVMVDYIGGNVERPYVLGALYNKDTKPDKYLFTPNNRAIVSETGERIEILPGNYDQLLAALVPFSGYVTPFLPVLTKPMTSGLDSSGLGEYLKTCHGKIVLTDTFGFWTIEGDTAGRSVTIDSMLGKVTVSAMTGINISAPLGDITIEGKNINIKASNNITIESGLEIKSERDKNATRGSVTGIGTIFKEVATDCLTELMAGKVDYSLLRSISEAICAPMEGTLKVKSHRYLNLEAGSGKAFDQEANPNESFISKDILTRSYIDKYLGTGTNGANLIAMLNAAKEYVNSTFESVSAVHGKACAAMNALKNYIKFHKEFKFPLSPTDASSLAKKNELLDVILDKDYQKAALSWPHASMDILNQYTELLTQAFNYAGIFWRTFESVRDAEKSVACRNVNIKISDKVFSEIKDTFDNKFASFISPEKLAKKMKHARRVVYCMCMSNFNPAGLSYAISEAAAADDKQWEQAVRTMYVKNQPPADIKFRNKFASNGWSFVDYERYQSEGYIKYPTARGKILFAQESGRCFEVTNNGTIKVENLSNNILALQRALIENDQWIA